MLLAAILLPLAYIGSVNGWQADYELREVHCNAPGPHEKFPKCSLMEDGDYLPFKCFPSKKGFAMTGNIRWYCNLRCSGATRTLDIRKFTHETDLRHNCALFYSYDTELRADDWYIWMDSGCFRSHNVTLTVWCVLGSILMLPHCSSQSHVRLFHRTAAELLGRGQAVSLLTFDITEQVMLEAPKGISNVFHFTTDLEDAGMDDLEGRIEELLWKPIPNPIDLFNILISMLSLGVVDPVFHPCAPAAMNALGLPYVAFSPLLSIWDFDLAAGTPLPMAANPNFMTEESPGRMALLDKAGSFLSHTMLPVFLSLQLAMARWLTPSTDEFVLDTTFSADLVMINTNRFLGSVKPATLSQVSVGLRSRQLPEPLEKALADFLDDPESNGTIIFSMSSFTPDAQMPLHIREIFLGAFKLFPSYRFLWRLEPEWEPAEVEEHILTLPWLPQAALVCMTVAQITHGGMNSILEAMEGGLPLLAIPMFGDQVPNSIQMVRQGMGRLLPKAELSVESVASHLRALLGDPGYGRRARKIRAMLADEKLLYPDVRGGEGRVPMSLAAVHIEYAARNSGRLARLKPRGAGLSTFVYFSLDVILLTLITTIAVSIVTLKLLLRLLC